MAVYDKNGNVVTSVYGKDGNPLNVAYDKNGTVIYRKNPITLKVMQYNCGQWYIGSHNNVPSDKDAEYYALQSGIIQNVDADVLLLEEYTAQFSKAGRTALSMLQSMYPYYHEETNGTTTTVTQRAIYSKYPISNYVTHPFNDGTTYYYDTCTITIDGIPIMIGCAHLHWNDLQKRVAEAQMILNTLSSATRFILGGDFNMADFSSTSGADYQQVIKLFVDEGYHIANGGDFGFIPTYCGTADGASWSNLDQIITSANITINSVTTDNTKATDSIADVIDHIPLIGTFSIN